MAEWDNHEGIVTADLSGFTIDGIQYLDIPRPAHWGDLLSAPPGIITRVRSTSDLL